MHLPSIEFSSGSIGGYLFHLMICSVVMPSRRVLTGRSKGKQKSQIRVFESYNFRV